MAGQSGHNLSIAKSKLGCRFPFESPSAGDGYAASGPCLVRKMTPEEKARYGPPPKPKEDNPFHSKFRQAIKVSKSPEQAAKLLGMTVGRLNQHLGANGLHPRWDKRKEDETVNDIQENMDNIVQADTQSPENKAPMMDEKQGNSNKVVQGQSVEGQEKPRTRFETIQENLTQKQYLNLKSEGLSDREILSRIDIPISWIDVLVRLKKGWEKAQTAPPEAPKEEPRAQPAAAGLTIARALELRDELTEDMKSWDVIHRSIIQGIELSARVVRILEGQRDIHQTALNRINEAFERTVLPL